MADLNTFLSVLVSRFEKDLFMIRRIGGLTDVSGTCASAVMGHRVSMTPPLLSY